MAYIKRIQMEIGEERLEINEEINSAQASMIIGELVAKVEKRNGINRQIKINEPRLGMAMKECYREGYSLGHIQAVLRHMIGDVLYFFIFVKGQVCL